MEKTCKTCRHWKPLPKNPQALSDPEQGQCRERLHSALIPHDTTRGVAMVPMSYYPATVETFPACDQYVPSLTIDTLGSTANPKACECDVPKAGLSGNCRRCGGSLALTE